MKLKREKPKTNDTKYPKKLENGNNRLSRKKAKNASKHQRKDYSQEYFFHNSNELTTENYMAFKK